MRALVLSDIHGNLEALEAVLAAAEGLFDQVWNLGDMVGYGGSPNQVVERMRKLSSILVRGNHDRVCCGLSSPNGFNPVARQAALWTRAALTPENLLWLQQAPKGPVCPLVPGVTCVHGSPLDEDQYILSMRDAWAPLQQMGTSLTFFGHTHVQGGFAQREEDWHELRPRYPAPAVGDDLQAEQDAALVAAPGGADAGRRAVGGLFAQRKTAGPRARWMQRVLARPRLRMDAQSDSLRIVAGTRYLINPGSVGQPRDFDWRAAFALYDSDAAEVVFRRVPYDLLGSQERIVSAGLPERLAARLREGR